MALIIQWGHKNQGNNIVRHHELSFKSQFQIPWIMVSTLLVDCETGSTEYGWVNFIFDPSRWFKKLERR
jgi:hypothetical protein